MEAKKSDLSPSSIYEINADIAQLPPCPEKGLPKHLNFTYWLALFKILQFHVSRIPTQQAPIRREILKTDPSEYEKTVAE